MKQRAKRLPAVGTIYLIPLPNGLFGACIVLAEELDQNVVGRDRVGCHIAALTGWWGEVPTLEHLTNRQIHVQDRYDSKGLKLHRVAVGKAPSTYIALGPVPLTPEEEKEAASPPTSLAGPWKEMAHSIYMEWCWLYDRPIAEADEEKRHIGLQKVYKDMERRMHPQGARVSLTQLIKRRPFGNWKALWGGQCS